MKIQKTGNFKKAITVKDEISRFRDKNGMPEEMSELLEIKNLQSRYIEQASSFEANKAQKIVNLASKYDKALAQLQKSLVRSGKLDDAKTVHEERERIANSKPVIQAKLKIKKVVENKSSLKFKKKNNSHSSKRAKTKVKFIKNKSMELYQKGYEGLDFPVQKTKDPTACFKKEPVYFNQKTGTDVIYEVNHQSLVKSLRWKGAAMQNMTIEIFDKKGNILAKGGPYGGGNTWGEFTIKFKPVRDFTIKISNHAGLWFFIKEIQLK